MINSIPNLKAVPPRSETPRDLPAPASPSRRTFIRSGLLASSGLALAGVSAKEAVTAGGGDGTEPCLDYGRSFLCNTAEFNSVRMWIESRTIIIDPQRRTRTVYHQGASCKSEHTFAEKDLFHRDNYDFLPVFGEGKVLVFRRHHNRRADRYRSIKRMDEMWGDRPVLHTPAAARCTELDTWEKISEATAAGVPIVTRTEIRDPATGLIAIIECPCKTMNISRPRRMYQVDTGPVAFPDLSRRHEPEIACLSLAFLAFNAPQFADFVIEAPTPILEGDREVATVHHYSRIISLPASNRIFALA